MKPIKTKDIEFLYSNQPLAREFVETLFKDRNGFEITKYDVVQFMVEGNILPNSGSVDDYKGLNIGCFNNITNKWEYYPIEVEP